MKNKNQPKIETKEDLERDLQKLKEERQENFMSKILNDVELLNEKANKKDYEPTLKELEDFRKVYNIINNMSKWF